MARLIDADALMESAKLFEAKACARGCGKSILHLAKAWLSGEVRTAPTIDPEELRPKGRWVRVQDSECYWFECSNCGEKPLSRYNHDCFTLYCPFCGAHMEDTE